MSLAKMFQSSRKFSVFSYLCFAVISILSYILGGVYGDRTFTKVYEPIQGTVACFKRLNGTHEIGCRSSAKGAVGVLHFINDTESLRWVLKDGPHAPYIAIMYPTFFSRDNLMQFKNSGRVNGVLLLKENDLSTSASTTLASFSPDTACPNNVFGYYNKTSPAFCPKWNSDKENLGSSLLFDKFDFPIFLVKDEQEAEKLLKNFELFNKPINGEPRSWPLCAAQLKSFMMAAKDTPTCMRRSSAISVSPGSTKVCDPLGDNNLWGKLIPQNKTSDNQTQSVLVLATRLDGASLFDEVSPSADTSVSGLVTFLTIIKQLSLIREQLVPSANSSISNIYFMVFNGESFGYIGSSRIAYDMKRGNFPISLEDIKYYVELNQVSLSGSKESYFIHQSDLAQSKEFTDILESKARDLKLNMKTLSSSASSWGLPPSSLHSFLRERKDLTGIVITNHNQTYRNKYYNSIFDTKESIQYNHGDRSPFSLQHKTASLAASISNSIISLLELPSPQEISPDLDTVDELLHCYLEDSNCTLFNELAGFSSSPEAKIEPYPLYVGVVTHDNMITRLTRQLLVTYLGTQIPNITVDKECWNIEGPGYTYFFNKTCWQCPDLNMTEATSPAFIIPDYDWASGKYSTWSESVWQSFSVKIFLKPSLLHEVLTLVSGIVVLVLSMFFMRFVNAKSDIIFPSRTDAMVC